MGALADLIVQIVKGLEDRMSSKVSAIEDRVKAIENTPHVKFCGTWTSGASYTQGDAVTHHGSLWICKGTTTGEPSKDFTGWQLAVKQGTAR